MEFRFGHASCELCPATVPCEMMNCEMRVEICALRTVGRATWLFRQSLLLLLVCSAHPGSFQRATRKPAWRIVQSVRQWLVIMPDSVLSVELRAASCNLRAAPCVLRDGELRDVTCEWRPAPCVPWVERPGYSDKAFFAACRVQDAARMSEPEFHNTSAHTGHFSAKMVHFVKCSDG